MDNKIKQYYNSNFIKIGTMQPDNLEFEYRIFI